MPEEKVTLAVDIVDLVTSITADSERKRNPGIGEVAHISRPRRFRLERRRPYR